MHHFFQAITNKKGDALGGFYVKLVDSADTVVPLYSDDAATPIINESGVADTALVDDDGNVSFWVEPGTYNLDIYASDGTTLYKRVSSVPMGLSTITLASGASVGTRTALSAISLPANLQEARLTEAGREGMFVFDSSDLSAEVTADTAQGIYVAPSSDSTGASGAWVRKFDGAADVKWFGALGDGSTDDTAAFTNTFAASSKVHIPAGTFIVSGISIPANTDVTTAGHDTIIKRKSGSTTGVANISITGSNVSLGDVTVEGLIASETGQQNHGVLISAKAATGNLQNIRIGNVKGKDLRGDAVAIGADIANGYTIKQVSVGDIVADNCWRCGLSVTDAVYGWYVRSVVEIACGQHTVDLEPNNAAGASTGGHIGYVRGRRLSFAGTNAGVECTIDAADLNPSYGSNSTPANSFDPKVASQAASTENGVILSGATVTIQRLNATGYSGCAIACVTGAVSSNLIVGNMTTSGCAQTDTTYATAILAQTLDFVTIHNLTATTSATVASESVVSNGTNVIIGKAIVSLAPATSFMRSCTDSHVRDLQMTAASGNGGIAFNSCTRCHVFGGTQAGDRFFSFCTRCAAFGVAPTMVTGTDVSPTATNLFYCSLISGSYHLVSDQTTGNGIRSDGLFKSNGIMVSSSATGGVGYSTGAGGTVTQATSKSTGVTLSKVCGAITMNGAALAAGAKVSFVVTNTAVAVGDSVIVNVRSGGTANAYRAAVTALASGSFTVTVENITAGSLSEAPVIGFTVIKSVTA